MNHRHIIFVLDQLKGIGWNTIKKCVDYFDNLTDMLHVEERELQRIGLKSDQIVIIKDNLNEPFLQQKISEYNIHNIHVVTYFDEQYPSLLKEIDTPPWVLYCKGDLKYLKMNGLAVVGTRNCTTYGKVVAERLSSQIAAHGYAVVSGLAKGVDKIAHAAALKEGATIAVVATGLDMVYPSEHTLLAKEIANHGLILSEYPIGTKAHRGLFPKRNRIIAGLSLGTLVIEAAQKSGSLITADHAAEYSRDVFAVPGQIYAKQSQGTMELIKQGAKLVTGIEDILAEYENIPSKANTVPEKVQEKQRVLLNEDEQKISTLIGKNITSIDYIIEHTKMEFGHLHTILLSLLMKNKIKQLPGSMYILVD
ncbi:DNA-processing protein DprA [Longirhabdus pacifica]|uniref:DNA-processing protein DprA n=1 Tax=Longirhabdus pacifica TaxID=2305227 RepID=UPI0010087968|nr:DNA-processing protein DprA [Longirhabdus pacifica]